MKRVVLCGLIAIGMGCGGEAQKPAPEATQPSPASAAGADASAPLPTNGAPPAPATEKPAPMDDPKQPADPLSVAQEAFDEGDADKGLAALDGLHKSKKPTVYSLVLTATFHEMRGRSAIKSDPKAAAGHFERAIENYQLADKASPDGLIPFTKQKWGAATYDLACAYALSGDPKKSLTTLENAYALGFDNLEHYATDGDLASVRELPEYEEFLARAREAARQKLRKEIAEFQPVDVSFEVAALDGRKISTADMKGKVLVVDCWATWCPPCRKMLPSMVKIYEQHKDKGLEVVGLNFERGDGDEAKETVEEFLKSTPLPYPCSLEGKAVKDKFPPFSGIPTCFYIDRAGKIRFQTVGLRPAADIETIIATLLEEKPPAP
ncbi:MAG: redoxin domain-containing protein [Planctomycetaceae bacterium]|nr:redoxin domain-containing protein [Planctomycetaceae bacterium]